MKPKNSHMPETDHASAPGSTRRQFLFATLGLTATVAVSALPGRAVAASVILGSDSIKEFIHVSQAITERKHLDVVLATRFYDSLVNHDTQFAARISQLGSLISPQITAQDFMVKATSVGLNEFLYQIVTAWYTGTVGDGIDGTLVAYKQALMYQTVSDGLIVPTYCGNGPIWWTAPIPDETSAFVQQL